MDCPECGKDINVGRMIGKITTRKKAAASRANGKRGGRPKLPVMKPTKIAARRAQFDKEHPEPYEKGAPLTLEQKRAAVSKRNAARDKFITGKR